ncbi:helix-turn-helix domain-containing protein, partial [Lactococcus petauri]
GLTQTEAAKLVGIHPQTLSKYENDSSEIRNSLVKDLAKIYSI